jgi:sRNA-binding protein
MTEEIKTPESKNQKCQRVLNNWLYVKYPDIFNHKKPKPLAIGTTKVLQKELPEGISVEDLKLAIGYHCRMQTYLRAVLIESHRVNLQGEPVAEIPLEDKKSAKDNLERVHKQQLESYLKRFLPATETPDVASAEPKETPVAPELKVTSEPVAEKVIVAEPVVPVVEEVKPKKLTLKPKTPPAEITPVIQAQTVANSGDCAKSRGLKVTLVLDPASIPNIDSTGMKKVPLKVQIGEDGLIATTELSSKSYRKAISSIEEYGVEGCNAILQGAMKQYGVIDDAGLVVQPKKVASSE